MYEDYQQQQLAGSTRLDRREGGRRRGNGAIRKCKDEYIEKLVLLYHVGVVIYR